MDPADLLFLNPPGEDTGVSSGWRLGVIHSLSGQGARLAHGSFYSFLRRSGAVVNPATDQDEQGYTQPLQVFTFAQAENRPSKTDSGVNVKPGIKASVPTSPIQTGMPWNDL